MNKIYRRQFLLLIIIIFALLSYKIYEQYTDLQHAQKLIILKESESLATFIGAFRQTYQDTFVYNHIKITDETMKLLAIVNIGNISNKFSASMNDDIVIRTVSDRPRNPQNMANKFELQMIKYFKINPDRKNIFMNNENSYNYIQPLYITQACLKCHGERKNAIESIRVKYDKAYDYRIGEIRGILNIETKKTELFDDLYDNLVHNTVISIIMFLVFSIFIYLLLKRIYLSEQKHQQTLFKQSRMAQMGEMISMIAHQWRQPLGAISTTSIDLGMRLEFDKFDEQYFNDSLKKIDSLVQNLTTTIDDFRNFYKPNKLKEKSLISLPISKAYTILETSFKVKDIVLEQEYNSKIVVNIYSNELMQVVLNILQNSYDNFLSTEIKNPRISVKTFDTQSSVVLEISDNGGGIDEEIIDNIFDPYFSTKDEKNGTGLGLYMSKVIIEEHHDGNISVKNTHEGVCFVIKIKNSGIEHED